nr:MAG TPA: hypothetical protein [Caudoviricetes sp.]
MLPYLFCSLVSIIIIINDRLCYTYIIKECFITIPIRY